MLFAWLALALSAAAQQPAPVAAPGSSDVERWVEGAVTDVLRPDVRVGSRSELAAGLAKAAPEVNDDLRGRAAGSLCALAKSGSEADPVPLRLDAVRGLADMRAAFGDEPSPPSVKVIGAVAACLIDLGDDELRPADLRRSAISTLALYVVPETESAALLHLTGLASERDGTEPLDLRLSAIASVASSRAADPGIRDSVASDLLILGGDKRSQVVVRAAALGALKPYIRLETEHAAASKLVELVGNPSVPAPVRRAAASIAGRLSPKEPAAREMLSAVLVDALGDHTADAPVELQKAAAVALPRLVTPDAAQSIVGALEDRCGDRTKRTDPGLRQAACASERLVRSDLDGL